jgi:hypothetical protein
MRTTFIVLACLGLAAGCSKGPDQDVAADTTQRDLAIPAADSTVAVNDAPAPSPRVDTVFLPPPPPPRQTPRGTTSSRPAPPPAAAPGTVISPAPAPAPVPVSAPVGPARLDSGTTLEAAAVTSITSRTNKAGETFTAKIGEAVRSADGRVVIPAGSVVTFSIVALKPAPNKAAKDGTIELNAVSVVIDGESRPLDADVTYVQHSLKGRGVTGSEAAKVGGGAVAGAIIGKVVGGGSGAKVGAVVGAAAGTAVAVESADRDVVVPVGGVIRLVLRSEF